MRVVIVDERGAVSDDLFNEVMTRLLADNPSFTQREASVPDYDLNGRDYQIEDLGDTYPHRGVLRGRCLQFSDGGAVNEALKALSLVYPTLAFGMEYSGDDSDANLYHCLLQNGQYVRSQFDGASYLVPSICSPKTHFFDCLMPGSVAERARVKVLRARKVITDIADMLQSDHFVGDDMREGGDKMKTARVTTQLRAASNALAIRN